DRGREGDLGAEARRGEPIHRQQCEEIELGQDLAGRCVAPGELLLVVLGEERGPPSAPSPRCASCSSAAAPACRSTPTTAGGWWSCCGGRRPPSARRSPGRS